VRDIGSGRCRCRQEAEGSYLLRLLLVRDEVLRQREARGTQQET
jgi:hypothetical protein